jgi:hypothetical protein
LLIFVGVAIGGLPGLAWAAQSQYYQGNLDNYSGHYDGSFVPRDYNQAWHQCSNYGSASTTVVQYYVANGSADHTKQDGPFPANCINPLRLGTVTASHEAGCFGAFVTGATCQTTRP